MKTESHVSICETVILKEEKNPKFFSFWCQKMGCVLFGKNQSVCIV